MLSVKQGGIKYHFLSFLYDSIWDWATISRTIGEHSTNQANDPVRRHITAYSMTRPVIEPWSSEPLANTNHHANVIT